MLIASRSLWVAETNTYVIASEAGGQAIIVDAPPDVEAILELVQELGVVPVGLLLTHGHVDHVGGAGGVAGKLDIPAHIHRDDDFLALDPRRQMEILFGSVPPGDYDPPAYLSLSDDQKLSLAGMTIEVLHTPGHTPGHCCFLIDGDLFSGDQLFAGSVGRTDLPGGSHEQLMTSMVEKVLVLDDEVTVHPGHGPATTVGRERRTNPFLRGI